MITKPSEGALRTNVLVLNCGSSSLKYRLISMPGEEDLAWGEAERVGIKAERRSELTHSTPERTESVCEDFPDHASAFRAAKRLLTGGTERSPDRSIGVIAHRYVHPGDFFSETAKLTERSIRKLRKTLDLAPLHNPTSFQLIDACLKEAPEIPQYAVFDTAFHSAMPEEFTTYAIPEVFTRRDRIRRMGFHGISHAYVMQEACRFLKRDASTQKIVSCHLGTGGASICAIQNGRSIHNTMGFTPLEGLMMNTRSGNLDPAAVLSFMHHCKVSARDAEKILIKQSGLVGLSKDTSDLREIVAMMERSPEKKTAFEMYIRRIKKYLGFYFLILKGIDILIFTDTIGMTMPLVRQKVCEGLGGFGIRLDPAKNGRCTSRAELVSDARSQVKVLCIPTNEELMIARSTYGRMTHDPDL